MEPHGRLLKKNAPWHDWPLHMWTRALYTKIVSQTIKPYCIKNRTTQLVGAYFHFWSDSPHPRWGNKTSITPPRMVVGTCCSSFKTLRANLFFFYGLKHVMVIKHGNFHQTFCGLGFTIKKTRRAVTLPVELFEWWPCATTTAFCARWAWVGWGFGPMKDK